MNKYPILILHGWNLDCSKYTSLINQLSKFGFKVYVPDLPGFGKTKIERIYNLADYEDFVISYLKTKKLTKINLIGHSFGGRISLRLSVNHQDKINSLILTGVPGFKPISSLRTLSFLILAKAGRLIFRLPILSSGAKIARKYLYKAALSTDYYQTPPELKKTFQNVVKEPLIDFMKIIKLPTLLIWGSDDKIVPLIVAKKMSKLISNAQLEVIPGARHGVLWTHSSVFAEKTNRFLSKL